MKNNRLILGIASTIAFGVVTYLVIRKKTQYRRLARVSEEGYETAYDILYPLKLKRLRN